MNRNKWVKLQVKEIDNSVSKSKKRALMKQILLEKEKTSKPLKVLTASDIRIFKKDKIKELREEYNNLSSITYEAVVTLGKYGVKQKFKSRPTIENLSWIKRSLFKHIDDQKQSKNNVTVEDKNFQGFMYQTTGGVFTQPNVIKDMNNKINPMDRINSNKVPYSKSKTNFIGIEFEFGSPLDENHVKEKLCGQKLEGKTYVKYDTSLRVRKNHFKHEVTFLSPEIMSKKFIAKTCKTIRDECQGYVNDSCGLHIHLDMRNRNKEHCYWNLVQCLPILSQIVPQSRIDNRYCQLNSDPNWHETEKYTAINTATYNRIQTIECRLHSGSLNPTKISNFISILLAIINADKIKSKVEDFNTFKKLTNISDELIEFMNIRREKFTDSRFDVDQDFGEDMKEDIIIPA